MSNVLQTRQKLEDLISDSFQSTSSKLNNSINDSVFIHNSDDEPDIVKSTKSRNTTPTQSLGREVNPSNIQVLVREVSPPDTLLPPVAPPRRKKRNRAAQSGNSISESSTEVRPLSNISLEPMSPGLPPSVDTPASDIIRHLSKGLDHSLDIQSVIDGKRHIRTEEAEIGAINSDKSLSPDVSHLLLREKLRVQRLSGETSSCGTSSLPSSPRPKRPERTISTMQSHSDEDIAMRPRSNSGRLLTDKEILESVMVLNLDTGDQIPLSVAEEKLTKCMNPLALYIMRRTKEYNSDSNLQKQFDNLTDDDADAKSEGGLSSGSSEQSAKTKAYGKIIQRQRTQLEDLETTRGVLQSRLETIQREDELKMEQLERTLDETALYLHARLSELIATYGQEMYRKHEQKVVETTRRECEQKAQEELQQVQKRFQLEIDQLELRYATLEQKYCKHMNQKERVEADFKALQDDYKKFMDYTEGMFHSDYLMKLRKHGMKLACQVIPTVTSSRESTLQRSSARDMSVKSNNRHISANESIHSQGRLSQRTDL